MLVLSRKLGEQIVFPNTDVTVEVIRIGRSRIWLGIKAPPTVPVHRTEVWHRTGQCNGCQPKANGNGARRIRVLIADPDQSLLGSYREFLSQNGFEVDTVTGGVDCVARLRERVPEVLVLDPQIPCGGGKEVLAAMREQPDVPRVPVLIHSSGGCVLGFCDRSFPVARHATRPLTPPQLAARIRELAKRYLPRTPLNSPCPGDTDMNGYLARWIARRTGGRLRFLRVETLPERVIVHGRARSYYARQLTQAAVSEAMSVLGPGPRKRVEFNIQVVPDGRRANHQ
jgi:carbon storage regulator CsrA